MRAKDLHRAQNKANLDKGNKSLLQAYKQIGALCDGWQLPSTVSDSAKHIYKDAEESRLFKGKSQDSLIAGCIFFACRRNGLSRSFREMMELTGVSKKEIGRIYKLLNEFLRNKAKADAAKPNAAPDGKRSTLLINLVFAVLTPFSLWPGRHHHDRRSRRPVPALLQPARYGSAKHERGYRSGYCYDQDGSARRSFTTVLRSCLHLHGKHAHG